MLSSSMFLELKDVRGVEEKKSRVKEGGFNIWLRARYRVLNCSV
jgi:hypothetical protein